MPIVSGGSGSGGGTATAINSTLISATPPTSPSTGSLWVFPADDTNGVYWTFVYDAAETTYKWRFIGGPPLWLTGAPNLTLNGASMTQIGASGGFYPTSGGAFSTPRAGDWQCGGQVRFLQTAGFSAPNSVLAGVGAGSTVSTRSQMSFVFLSASTSAQASCTAFDVLTGLSAGTTVAVVGVGGDPAHTTFFAWGAWLLPVRVI